MEVRFAIVQNKTSATPAESLDHLEELLLPLRGKCDVIVLPEMCLQPYQAKAFVSFAQEKGGTIYQRLQQLACQTAAYLVAGTVAEKEDERIYNTSYVFDTQGNEIAKHRKMHLFDIAIKGGQHFRESDRLTPGDEVTTFKTEFGTMGLMICYDVRFPELARLTVDEGAQVLIVPGAFNETTGPLHWELHFRARAVDNQVYTIGCAPASNPESGYSAYGHSIACDPWGRVLLQMERDERVEIVTLDLDEVKKVREQLPLLAHRRKDIYRIVKSR